MGKALEEAKKDKYAQERERVTDAQRTIELIITVVHSKLEKELDTILAIQERSDREKYIDNFVKEYVSNFDSIRQLFALVSFQEELEKRVHALVTREALEDLKRKMKNRQLLKDSEEPGSNENLVFERLRHDIASKDRILEAYKAIGQLIARSKQGIEGLRKARIDLLLRIKELQHTVTSL